MTKLSKKEPWTPEQKAAVTKFTAQLDRFFGLEAEERDLYFHTEPCREEETAAAEIKQDKVYRRVSIHIYPPFWTVDVEQRAIYLLHEYCHSVVENLSNKAHNLLDGKLETREHIRQANEQTTSHLSIIFNDLLRSKPTWIYEAYNAHLKTK